MTPIKEEVMKLRDQVEYAKGSVVSKSVIKKESGTITLFAFDEGEKLSEHSAPYDALVQILDGEADIMINQKIQQVKKGESIILPANIPHALTACQRFKMMLTMIKEK
jgi:quercetin dioxygenase-like cupin family protein